MIDKVITPDDLLDYLRRIRVEGRPILTAEPRELLPQTLKSSRCLISPMMVAVFLVVLAVVGLFRFTASISFFLLFVQSIIGLAESYIVFVSDLPASSWNWLVVPFNPLPLVLWRWRRYWAWGFVAILLVWEAFMLFSPHQLTDPAYLVIVLAYVVFYAKMALTPVTKSI